jgi:hypothetical protein
MFGGVGEVMTINKQEFKDAIIAAGIPDKCVCTISQRMVGDGCEICNPELAKQISLENLDEDDE